MGAIVPTITGLTTALNAVDTLVGTVQGFGQGAPQDNSAEILRQQQALALQNLKAQQAENERTQAEQALLSKQKIQAEADAAERARLSSLRRAVARQRASFGASGIGNTDGSSEAVLLGLFEETDQDRAERERLDDIRNRALDQELDSQSRLNVLQLGQLQQKQQLERAVEGDF